MVLTYKFKKEKLDDGSDILRPKIFVELKGTNNSIQTIALIDSGSDVTVIPEIIARDIGLNFSGQKTKIYAYRESNDVIKSKTDISFLGRANRESVKLSNVPIFISLEKDGTEEDDIILGIDGVFDAFDITFKKTQNRIFFKPQRKSLYN